MAVPKRARERIAKARYHLIPEVKAGPKISAMLNDPDLRNYLDTWVMPELDALRDWAKGERHIDGGPK